MCSICGIYDYERGRPVPIEEMGATMKHRGPDDSGSFYNGHLSLGHNRLSVIDPALGAQPMTVSHGGHTYTIVYNGELYNSRELLCELLSRGIRPKTRCDTELLLYSYALYKEECVHHLNGIFAFCVYDQEKDALFLARDRLGVKPLYYAEYGGRFYFASEIKAILTGSGMPAELDKDGLFELLYTSPVTLKGSAVLRGIKQVKAGFCGTVSRRGLRLYPYYRLKAEEAPKESEDEMVAHTHDLLYDAIRRQLVSDVPLCAFLSGGLDSSIITAVAAREYKKEGRVLSTYSFEYEDNKSYAPTLFQPNRDDDYAVYLAGELSTDHRVLTAPTQEVARLLPEAAIMRDMPGQADVDSSLLYFCGEVKRRHTVALSGECADEIFGGYPWFYRPEMLKRDVFPWVHDASVRASIFSPEIVEKTGKEERLREVFREAVANAPLTGEESEEDKNAKIACYLSVNYFMENLLARKDRMSMARGLEVRVPFADHRILSYVYNLPWAQKFKGGVEKSLLRRAMSPYLPDKILNRKKSPYPKTHNPRYEEAVRKMLEERLADKDCPLSSMLDREKLTSLLKGEDVTWFGQLMGKPQLLGWLVGLDAFLTAYRIRIV